MDERDGTDVHDVQILVTPDPVETAERDGFAPVTTLPTTLGVDDARLSSLERRFLQEVSSLRAELLELVEERLAKLEAVILGSLGEARGQRTLPAEPPGEGPEGEEDDEPA
ncbi:MAG: hypothetical protein HY240_03070 [Actinobacteria bacterium]|nr:hypothetical protein [Actinomycetota bacterium]